MTFKFKSKPKEPVRHESASRIIAYVYPSYVNEYVPNLYGSWVKIDLTEAQDLIDKFLLENPEVSEEHVCVLIHVDADPDESSKLCVVYQGPELDKDFDIRLKSYDRRLEKYLAWYETNKDRIEEELAKREAAATERQAAKAKREEAAAVKEIAALEKKLALLKKKQT